jgi:acylphosphatase
MHQARFKITGKVQGVFYRSHARDKAEELNLKGIIKNMPDGSVEATLQGEKENLIKFKEWAYKGSPSSKVHDIEITFETPETPFFTSLKTY